MPVLHPVHIAELLQPYLPQTKEVPVDLYERLSLYLVLLLRWNAHTNLTAIRTPEVIVTRHFGESLFAATLLPAATHTVLDLGSGAGFPGIPIQLLRPDLAVTLAESQGKKAAFLQEVVRTLALPTRVLAARAETLLPEERFSTVVLRAVDRPVTALKLARQLSQASILLMTTGAEATALQLSCIAGMRIPQTRDGVVLQL